jgi:hypothetical protein
MPVQELSAAAVLDLWQAAERRRPVERALALAAAAGDERGAEELAVLPVGRRDARILALHAALGGGALEATARCPGCGEQAEFAVDPDALLATVRDAPAPTPVEVDGLVVVWRPPDSRDLAAAAGAGDAAAADRLLLERCVTSPTTLTTEARAAVARAMAEADPLAEILVGAACPACGVEFVADVDVAAFVWTELRVHARRLLREVDALARAYGWTEAEVLSLNKHRRAAYLALAQEGRA